MKLTRLQLVYIIVGILVIVAMVLPALFSGR
jgi:hypothetical protein